MKRQRGQSAVEFALIIPLFMLMVLSAIYGGAMFIQFLNFNNEARTIARQLAVTTAANRANGIAHYNSLAEKPWGIYYVKMTVWVEPADNPTDVFVRYDFNRSEFPFGFPPAHFATSFGMKIEDKD